MIQPSAGMNLVIPSSKNVLDKGYTLLKAGKKAEQKVFSLGSKS
jgi:hypothetical protein